MCILISENIHALLLELLIWTIYG